MITVGPVFSATPGANPLPAGMEQTMDAAASSALTELLAAYLVNVERSTGLEAPLAALGVVRFTAPGLNGTATLGASTGTLRRSNPRGTSDRDWIAELANQFVGRFKLKLLRAGFELWTMTPVAITGRLLITAVSQPGIAPVAFRDVAGGALALWMEVEVNGPLKFTPPASDAAIPSEGDVILFDS